MEQTISPVARLWTLLHEEKSDITSIYFYAILSGLIQLSLPLAIQAIIGFVQGGTMRASLVVLISIVVVSVLLAGILQMNQMKIIEKIQQKIFVKMAYAFADRIPKLDLRKIDSLYLPELVNRFFDTVSLQKSISKLLLDLPVAIIQIVFGLMLLSFYHPFFILFGVLLVFILWLILRLTSSKGFESSLAESKYKYGLVGWLEEMARLVKSFKYACTTGLHLKKADEKTIHYIKARTTHFGVLLLQYKSLIAFKVAITAALMIVGVILLLNQQLNIAQFIATEIIIITVINAVEKIIISLENVYDALTSVEKLAKLTDKPVETSGSHRLDRASSIDIEARNLSFSYYHDKPVFENASFSIKHGEKICIAGKDGSGKSTLLKLLTGAYNEFTGSLLINNVPIGNYDLLSLREKTGILFPKEDVFHGTLWENITMGRQGIDPEYVHYLCSQTRLTNFLATLPQGYDTELDPTGNRLAGNVIQKILLVRALAAKPRLLLAENPWINIEEDYKQDVQHLLLHLPDTTVLIASNDPSFANSCDQCIYLSK